MATAETATLAVRDAVEPGTLFVVRATRLPATGTVLMEPGKTRSVLGFFGVLGALLVAVAWGFGVRRWLRRRALSGPVTVRSGAGITGRPVKYRSGNFP